MSYKIFIAVFCCLIYISLPIHSQRGKGKSKAKTQVTITPEDIDVLLNAYQFEDASTAIEDAIDAATRKKMDTSVFEKQSHIAVIGENMLQSTAKIIFIDSIVVNKNDFLKALKLHESCGTICRYEEVFETTNASNKIPESTVFINEFKDRMIYASVDKSGSEKLYERIKLGSKWSSATRLQGIGDSTDVLGYPYILNDGTTLYFAAKDANSLGGYDIYVTRYNPDSEQYVKAENIGMPFNSPANDYLYVIDEANNLGWFVSDRFQPEGKVCIYTFIPAESRTNYNPDEISEDSLRSLAQIRSIKESQSNRKAVADALKRLQEANNITPLKVVDSENKFCFYVANGLTYKSLDSFKSAKAQQLAQQWQSTSAQREKLLEMMNENRLKWKENASATLSSTILKQERELEQLDVAIKTLENNIRKEEAVTLKR